MYCPRCAQQQSSDEARFCPRCGLRLEAVGEALSGGGVTAREAEQSQKRLARLRRGVIQGSALVLLGLLLVPLLAYLFDASVFSALPGGGRSATIIVTRPPGAPPGAVPPPVPPPPTVIETGGARALFAFPQALVPLAALVFFGGGFLRILWALFSDEWSARLQRETAGLAVKPSLPTGEASGAALPPRQSVPVDDWSRPPAKTAEIVSQPSVTEGTTKLLDEEPNS